jgi:hypothetical protein
VAGGFLVSNRLARGLEHFHFWRSERHLFIKGSLGYIAADDEI